jgi:AAA family ATP:ADP antiporter
MNKDTKISSNSSSEVESSSLSKYIDIIWPIHRHELPKFFLMTGLMFCILFDQNIIRAMKDGIIVTNIGPETITFLKFWGVMPASFMMAAIYVAMVNRMNGRKVFFLILGAFLIFFAIFGFIIMPNHESFHLNKNDVNLLVEQYPHFKWFILLAANWSFSLFYIIAELWPTTVFSLLFWQFANNITSVDESKRFYTLFGLFGQTGLYFSGIFLGELPVLSSYFKNYFFFAQDKGVISVQLSLILVIILGLCTILIFNILSSKMPNQQLTFKAKKKHKLSVSESLKLVVSSRYIRLIAILLFCYGAAINLVEGPWKATAGKVYPNTEDYFAFVGSYLKYTGILVIIFVVIGSNIVRYAGWLTAALATPVMLMSTGLIFFFSSNFDLTHTMIASYFLLTDPIMIAVSLGAVQNVLSKSTKYTLFDATKEMVYVPLDHEIKTKGKAAADLIGTKFGKSASAFLQTIIFSFFPYATYASISSILMVFFVIICITWIWCVRELEAEYSAKVRI